MRMSYKLSMLAVLLLMLLIAGCATGPKPQPVAEPGKGVETLQSPVAITITAGGTSRSVRGFLIFKRPDRFHLAVLGPFGITLLEVYSEGDRLTCLIPSKELACSGLLAELPEGGGLKSWQIMKWVVEEGPVAVDRSAGEHERLTTAGEREALTYDKRGLLVAKVSAAGDRITYDGYRSLAGVAFPSTIEFKNLRGEGVRIAFEEPELNQPVEEAVLTPHLDGITLLPLTACNGL